MNEIESNSSLLNLLEERFKKNMHRHPMIAWEEVLNKIKQNEQALLSIKRMEDTGGEPDVVQVESYQNEILFFDCSKESPNGRRSLCYDREALLSRKKFPPKDSAINMAQSMGVIIANEKLYREVQNIEVIDLKSQSWVETPKEIRNQGGAIFCDHRYGNTFTYHNGADSYYGVRGFRGYIILK